MNSAADPAPQSTLRRLAWLGCAAAALLAAGALTGWIARVPALTNLVPGYPGMNPLTAVCVLCCALALALRTGEGQADGPGVRIARAVAALAGILAGSRFLAWLVGVDLTLDLGLLGDRVAAASFPARMGVQTCLGMAAIAWGVVGLDFRTARGWRVSDSLFLIGLGVSTIALIGYLYGSSPMHTFTSIPSSMCGLLLAGAAFLARPDRGLCRLLRSPSPGGVMARRVLSVAIPLPVLLGWVRLEAQRRGLVGLEVGLSMLVLSILGIVITIVWLTARDLDRADQTRKRAELDLRLSLERQSRILDSNLIGILTAHEDGWIVDANVAFLSMLGYTREDLPLHTENITPPEWRGRTQHAVQELGQQGFATPFEKEYLRKDGTRVSALVGATRLPGQEKEVLAFVVDLSAKRSAELEAERLRRFLDSIVENLPNMVFVKDARELRFVRLNRAGEELLGLSREDLVGKNDFDFFPREEAEFFTSKDRAVLNCRVPLDIPEEPIETRHHGARILHTQKVPILDEDGTPLYLLGISEDITERKHAERQMAKLNTMIRQRGEQLEAANRELESFSYSVSHDLRAPLRHMDGFCDLLLRHAGATLDEKSRRYLDVISTSAKSMGELIDDLLAFSRTSRTQLRCTPVDLAALARDLQKELSERVSGRRVEWKVGSLPTVYGDFGMLRVVFTNLFSNALKYSAGREPAVIEVTASESNGEHVVCVRDNGVGFDMQYQHKLFGVFQRLHRNDEFEGTGIGLATVRRIVDKHGGRTWAEGQLDHGASFFLALPREVEAELEREAA